MKTMKALPDNKAIGENIYLSHRAGGMRAMKAAKKTGIYESAYTHYERGERQQSS